MSNIAAFSILALTVSLSLGRPKVGPLKIHHSTAAIIGALLTLSTGLVPIDLLFVAVRLLFFPVVTIVSLMIVTLIAERAGVFEILAWRIARAAKGDGRKLFAYLFFTGTLTGTVFTNDAAVLIFTPLVFNLIEEVQGRSWTLANKIPYYFAVLFVANVGGALVISNPINLIVTSILGISFGEYAEWMIVPAAVSVAVSFVGIRLFFRKSIPERFYLSDETPASPRNRRFLFACGAVLALTLLGFFTESLTGVPVWLVALLGAVTLLVVQRAVGHSGVGPIFKGVGWDVIVFVYGIFIVAMGLRSAGLTHQIGQLIKGVSGPELTAMTFSTGFVAAVFSSVMNNHPTVDMMAWVIQDFSLPKFETKMLAFAALIGGGLGPKMLPIGSLTALLWFRLLRDRGVHIPYSLYIKIGVPVTLAAILLSIAALHVELFLHSFFAL